MSGGARAYVFAGGGTAGHLAPALAVAEALRTRQPDAAIVILCTTRSVDERFLREVPYGVVAQPVKPLPRGPLEAPGFLVAWVRSCRMARSILQDVKPAAVLGLGGYAAGPMVRTAARRQVPTALLNPDAIPGKANRFLAGSVDLIFTQFRESARHFPSKLSGKIRHVGCPLRPGVGQGDRSEAMRGFGLHPGSRTLAVMGGSLGAGSINDAMGVLAPWLAESVPGWQVLHVTGVGKAGDVENAYRRLGVHAAVLEFCDRMDLFYAAADLVIARGGANTVAELTASATPAVILPYPYHKDQHQRHNAAAMVAVHAAAVVDDLIEPRLTAQGLKKVLEKLLCNPARLADMAAAAGALAPGDAARRVADWLIQAG